MDQLAGRRDLIDRKALAAQVAALAEAGDAQSVELRTQVLELLKQALADGRGEIQQRFDAGASGQLTVTAGSFFEPFETFDSGVLGTGQAFDLSFDAPGEYALFCVLHPDMTGTVYVE